MSELLNDFNAHWTENILRQIQTDLQPFARRPEDYNFTAYDADHYMLVCGTVGTLALDYNRHSQVAVQFAAELGFTVTAGYQLYCGIDVKPLSWERIGALQVEDPDESGRPSIYRPAKWPDGGCSLRNAAGDNLLPARVGQIGWAVDSLVSALHRPNGAELGVVK